MSSKSLPSFVRTKFSDRSSGNFAVDETNRELAQTRDRFVPGVWRALNQTHSADVVVISGEVGGSAVDSSGSTNVGKPSTIGSGDGLVTDQPNVVLSIQTADCVPVLFSSSVEVIGAAHGGWRGLYDGILGNTVDAMRNLGAIDPVAWVGPHICVSCYEFSTSDLTKMALRFGPEVVGATTGGNPALDLSAAVRSELASLGVAVGDMSEECTSCTARPDGDPAYFSYRARSDSGRNTSAIWTMDVSS